MYNVAGEAKTLKHVLQELAEIKQTHEDNHTTPSSQWQSCLNASNKQMNIVQNENLALKAEIIDLKTKLEILSTHKKKGDIFLNLKQPDLNTNKEVEMLKETHAQHISGIKEKFTHALTEKEKLFGEKMKDLKNYYEKQILDIISKHDKTTNNGNPEIQSLYKNYRRMHDEVCGDQNQNKELSDVNEDANLNKIMLFEKCLWKMNRLFKKSQMKYNKQISKLKHEVEMKDKALQLQLTAQRLELLATTNTKKQVETDVMVVLLEERYRKLLESQQAQYITDKRNDAKIISALQAMLTEKNITAN